MKVIGLTGGIGSGKSLVARSLEAMGYPVYFSDERAKDLVDSDPDIRRELIELIGTEVYQNGKLNRPFLAEKLFSNDDLRLKVNEIIHPRVRAVFANWVSEQQSPIVFNEAAILFETGAFRNFDKMVLVTAPEELKIERVMKRDNCAREMALERMSKQWKDEAKIPLSDYVLVNDDRIPLLEQIEKVIVELTV